MAFLLKRQDLNNTSYVPTKTKFLSVKDLYDVSQTPEPPHYLTIIIPFYYNKPYTKRKSYSITLMMLHYNTHMEKQQQCFGSAKRCILIIWMINK